MMRLVGKKPIRFDKSGCYTSLSHSLTHTHFDSPFYHNYQYVTSYDIRLKIEFRKECWFDSGQGHHNIVS